MYSGDYNLWKDIFKLFSGKRLQNYRWYCLLVGSPACPFYMHNIAATSAPFVGFFLENIFCAFLNIFHLTKKILLEKRFPVSTWPLNLKVLPFRRTPPCYVKNCLPHFIIRKICRCFLRAFHRPEKNDKISFLLT